MIAVDWQLIDRAVGPRDLAYFVSQSVNVTTPTTSSACSTRISPSSPSLGVDVDRDWAWEMYRYGAMFGFVYPVVAAGALGVEDPRHVQLTGAMLQRSIAAIETLDAFEPPL